MFGLRQDDALASLEPAREFFRCGSVDHAIGASSDDQNGNEQPSREFRLLEAPHEAKGGIGPANCWIPDCEIRRRLDDRRGPCVPHWIGGEDVALKVCRHFGFWAAARHETASQAKPYTELGEELSAAPEPKPVKIDHR
jgi:hypothetical protein